MKNLAILGSTGSIGTQTLDVVRKFPHQLNTFSLSAGSNISLLQEQMAEFKPYYVHSQAEIKKTEQQIMTPEDMAAHPDVDIVVIATSGVSALRSLMAAVRSGKIIALANKESLVSAGSIVMAEAANKKAEIRPVDSEHSAIWQCLNGEKSPPARLLLTASGGPFLHYSQAELAEVTLESALRHPSWKMGRKVTIDSATLMNKGMEVLEASYLFGMPLEDIEVVIHPQSIIHSLVEYKDGVLKAQLSRPDMRLPIQYALSYPERWDNDSMPRLDLIRTAHLDFQVPDTTRFPCLKLAIEAGKKGGTFPAVLCAADEVVVELFLQSQIKFTDIAKIVGNVLAAHIPVWKPSLDDIIDAHRWARETSTQVIKKARTIC
jgi:1-deoxy-D-xylulose-5-phosphate reductoisomerase